MTQSIRPGGLTALAVINFVYAAIYCFLILGAAVFLIFANVAEETITHAVAQNQDIPPDIKAEIETTLYAQLISHIIIATLLIVSAIGYLQLKKTLGYKLGNLYALLSITSSILFMTFASQGFTILDMIAFIYPLITLLLINTTFKEDFIK